MVKLARLNRLPEREKTKIYSLLIPPSILRRFQLDPVTGRNHEGDRCITIDAPAGQAEAAINLVSHRSDPDPAFYVEVSDSRDLEQLSWDFVNINDPDAPRFYTDLTPTGGSRWLDWQTRNRTEELMALSSGLAPGQVRVGLRLTGEFNHCLDSFCAEVGFKSIALEALFYHNAIHYERHGFRYFRGEPMMRWIHREFGEGGRIRAMMDDSRFRRCHFSGIIRGRSWAIHDGVLSDCCRGPEEVWNPPRMYRMAGDRNRVDTAPGMPY